ncbi:MAG: dCTP deaminase [Magnetococcus sp. XQGC-1]
MRLSDVDIRKMMQAGEIEFSPFPSDECFGSFSVDVRLGHAFQVFQLTQIPFLDLSDAKGAYSISKNMMREMRIADDELFFLHPGEFALGMTLERIRIGDSLVGWLDGRSSLARVGLMVHITAHSIDPGWDGNITFEFFNAGKLPLAMKAGMRIGAVSFEQLSSPSSRPYGSKRDAKYFQQKGPVPSIMDKDD